MSVTIVPLETASLGDRSYLAHDGEVAFVVDPQRDTDRVLDLADEAGVRITDVFETHIHNDYVTGGLALAREVGARVVQMPSAEHDEAVAKVSHLPQLMASLVGERLVEAPAEHLRLAGQGLRDVTRIAGSDPGLWRQIVAANADAVRVELRAIAQALNEFVAVLDEPEAVERLVAAGRAGVRRLPGKHGLALASYARVDVEIPDTPGALAKLFAQIDASDINVEDLSIEHDDARQVGYLAVYVVPDRAGELAAAMSAAGWRLRP